MGTQPGGAALFPGGRSLLDAVAGRRFSARAAGGDGRGLSVRGVRCGRRTGYPPAAPDGMHRCPAGCACFFPEIQSGINGRDYAERLAESRRETGSPVFGRARAGSLPADDRRTGAGLGNVPLRLGGRIMTHAEGNRIAWAGAWSRVHNNARYEELLPRLTNGDRNYVDMHPWWPIRGLRRRIWLPLLT